MQQPTNHPNTTTGRRDFIKSAGATAAGLFVAGAESVAKAQAPATDKTETLAVKGGPKAITANTGKATHWPRFEEADEKEVVALLRSPNYTPIPEFEKAWAEFHKVEFCKAHCNGTNALTSMLFALDFPPGSEILVPDFSTFFPVVPMRFFDLVPVFVDINPKTLNIDVEDCKRRLTKNTRAILPVHWYGLPCDLDHICDFAKEHNLDVLEDCSHAHGASVKGQLVGTWGRMSGFSLQLGKPLPAIEGGMGMYKNRLDFERAVTYGNYELPTTFPADSPYRKYQGTALGSKLRIHPIAAILAKNQLSRLVEHNALTIKQTKEFNDRITQLPGVSVPYCRPDVQRVHYGNNLILLDTAKAGMSREACIKALQAEGVGISGTFGASATAWTLLHTYPMFSEQKWWRHMPVLPDKVPGCDEANRTLCYLPLFNSEAPAEVIDQHVKAFEKVWAHRSELT
jgi:dTDP-4-amino-4,6-dideoxygalactose transaminase